MSDATTEAWFNRTMAEWYAANPRGRIHPGAAPKLPDDEWQAILPRCLGMIVRMDRREEARLRDILAWPDIGKYPPPTW